MRKLTCLFAIISLISFLSACQSPKPTDLKTYAPAETLVYLETNNVAETIQALTQSKSFQELSKTSPNLSALKNIQAAVVVTGFETDEKKLTDESSILRFKPRFALIAETHTWESTAISLVENQIGNFVKEQYGDDVKFDKGEKNGLKFFNWTSKSGEKIFSTVSGSIIFVANDENVIEKCLAAKKGEIEQITKNQQFADAYSQNANNLAFGYISADGIGQISNLAGVSLAIGTSEEDIVRSFIAKNIPLLFQKTAKEIIWTAKKAENGIEDNLLIKTDAGISNIWKETLNGANNPKFEAAKFLPKDFNSITHYNLQNPNLAWQSILQTSAKQLDEFNGKILIELSGSFFEPYNIANSELFLSSIGNEIVTARFDAEGDQSIVIAEVKDLEKLKSSIDVELNLKAQPEKLNSAEIWKSEDKSAALALVGNYVILGETQSVLKSLQAQESGQNFAQNPNLKLFTNNKLATTLSKDAESAKKIVEVLGELKDENKQAISFYSTETSFNNDRIERKTVSGFGLIGLIIEQFNNQYR